MTRTARMDVPRMHPLTDDDRRTHGIISGYDNRTLISNAPIQINGEDHMVMLSAIGGETTERKWLHVFSSSGSQFDRMNFTTEDRAENMAENLIHHGGHTRRDIEDLGFLKMA